MTAIPNNLLSLNDASFETSVAGWSPTAGLTIAQSTTQALDGTHSLKGTVSTTGFKSINTGAYYGVAGGAYYTVYCSMTTPVGPRAGSCSILWYDSSHVQIGATILGPGVNVTSTGWAQCAVTALAPVNAAYATASVNFSASVNTDTFYVDQVALIPGRAAVVAATGFTFTSTASAVASFLSIAGDTLVAVVAFNQNLSSATVTGVTDSAGNTWSKVTDAYGNAGSAGSQGIAVWKCTGAAAVTTVTTTFSASVPSACVCVFDLSAAWCYTASLVEFAASAAPSAAVTSVSSPISPNIIGDLLINAVSTGSANVPTNSLGGTNLPLAAGAGTTETQLAVTYQTLTTTGVPTPSGGTATSTFMASATVALRATPFIASDTVSQPLADITLVAQGLTGYDTLTINRTNPLTGVTAPVRAANAAAQVGDVAFVADYEAPLGSQNQWVIVASHANIDGSTTTATSVAWLDTIPVVYGETWLKSISQPALSQTVQVIGPMGDVGRDNSNTTYQVMGTGYPVVIGDVLRSRKGVLSFLCQTYAAFTNLLALIQPGQVILFQATAADNFPDMYFMVTGPLVEKRPEGASASPYRQVDVPFTEVAQPLGSFSLVPGNTWSQVLSFSTWQNVLSWRSTWLGVLNVKYGAGTPH